MKRFWIAPMRIVFCLSAILVVFEGCKTTSQVWMPSHKQLITLSDVAEQTDAESLRRGRILAVTECANCHRQYWPNEYSEQKWPPILQKMGKRASLDENQVRDLINYHVAASRASLNREKLEENSEN